MTRHYSGSLNTLFMNACSINSVYGPWIQAGVTNGCNRQ